MPDIRYQLAVNREIDNDLSADLAEIEVQQNIEGPTTFRIRFAVDICGDDIGLLDDERLNPGDPDTEITVLAVLAGVMHVLSHGIIVERQAKVVEGGPGSYLEIRGQDRRAVMDREQRCVAHSGTAADIVTPIFEHYGLRADVADTPIEYDENSNTLNQTESDLAFVDKVAGRSDVRFWIDWTASSGLTGFEIEETAHFKPSPPRAASGPLGISLPPLLAPEESAELKLNAVDNCSNVSSFEVSSNAETPNQSGPVQRVSSDTGELDETEVPEPTSESLGAEPSVTTQPRTRRIVSAGRTEEAQLRTQAALNDASFNVKATAETSVHALNNVLGAHQLVTVTGAGRINSGQYFVSSVTHAIDASDHKMRLELMRNGMGA